MIDKPINRRHRSTRLLTFLPVTFPTVSFRPVPSACGRNSVWTISHPLFKPPPHAQSRGSQLTEGMCLIKHTHTHGCTHTHFIRPFFIASSPTFSCASAGPILTRFFCFLLMLIKYRSKSSSKKKVKKKKRLCLQEASSKLITGWLYAEA